VVGVVVGVDEVLDLVAETALRRRALKGHAIGSEARWFPAGTADLAPGVITWDRVTGDTDHQKNKRGTFRPMLFNVARFAVFSGLLLLGAWIAGTGRVAYVLIMLVIAAALAYAVLDLVDYEIVRRKRRG